MTGSKLITLHRQWIWANTIKMQFAAEMKRGISIQNIGALTLPIFAYLFIWYGLLYSVLEVFKKEKIKLSSWDNDIFNILYQCRNGVFHVQSEYLSQKILKVIMPKDTARKIYTLHEEAGAYLLEEIDRLKEKKVKSNG